MTTNISKILLDSQFSINQSKTNPIFILSKAKDTITGYCVSQFNAVNTITNINERNNKFNLIDGTTNSSGTLITTSNLIKIPIGNYNIDSFISQFNTTINVSAGNVYTLSNNTMSNLLTLEMTSQGNTQNSFKIADCNNNCYYELGLNDSLINTTLSSKIEFPESYDLSGIKTIHLVSSSFTGIQTRVANQALNIVLSIPIEVSYASAINYHNESVFISTDTQNLSQIEFELYDDRLKPIKSQMRDWSVSLFLQSS